MCNNFSRIGILVLVLVRFQNKFLCFYFVLVLEISSIKVLVLVQ